MGAGKVPRLFDVQSSIHDIPMNQHIVIERRAAPAASGQQMIAMILDRDDVNDIVSAPF